MTPTDRSRRKRVLVLFAHPAFEKSRVNRELTRAVTGLSGVTFHDLYEAYPDFDVDVRREQSQLVEHDVVVLQHPFYWYGTPPLLKQWIDLVLEHGWAYGKTGRALAGKFVFNAISCGGGERAYRPGGHNRFTIRQLLAPIEQTFTLCRTRYLAPFVVYGTHAIGEADLARHARHLASVVEAMRDGHFDFVRAASAEWMNRDLGDVLTGPAADALGEAR